MTESRIVPYLCVSPAAEAIEFYRLAFGAEVIARETVPSGETSHCRMRVGSATFYLADPYPQGNWAAPATDGHSVGVQFECANSREMFDRAIVAGATLDREFKSDDYGEWGIVIDPYGHHWTIIHLNESFAAVTS